ncbi:flagellar protein FlaG [uncultured Pseudomonas sp.]|uniref:flagellar protein FlaG n=1 Tax=uncultured Pseudomonas sp. TaxID=114707 RepID=UPI00260EB6D6|nr:flagellar protein FlaG [uncultured Pseudomonas sp.]
MDIAKLATMPQPATSAREPLGSSKSIEASALEAVAALAANQPEDPTLARQSLDSAVASISSFVQSVQRSLDFSVDDSSGEVVVKVTDRDSGEVIRQLPSEEALRLSEQLESLRSLMFEARA